VVDGLTNRVTEIGYRGAREAEANSPRHIQSKIK
jgi:hypothetical protein